MVIDHPVRFRHVSVVKRVTSLPSAQLVQVPVAVSPQLPVVESATSVVNQGEFFFG